MNFVPILAVSLPRLALVLSGFCLFAVGAHLFLSIIDEATKEVPFSMAPTDERRARYIGFGAFGGFLLALIGLTLFGISARFE